MGEPSVAHTGAEPEAKRQKKELEKEEVKQFRQYFSDVDSAVRDLYRKMRLHQNVDTVRAAKEKYSKLEKHMTIWEAFDSLSDFVDVSDPDVDLPNAFHLFQSAEGARLDGKPEWMQFTALIHDLGKCIYLRGCDEDGTSVNQQWAIVGDTFVVGDGELPDCLVHPEFNKLHKAQDVGYKDGCGLSNVLVAYGHDEYLYEVLRRSPGVCLPNEAFYMVRFHSMYPWHTGNAYERLEDEIDKAMKPVILEFNKYDLYTKTNTPYTADDIKKMREYYTTLINKFAPQGLVF